MTELVTLPRPEAPRRFRWLLPAWFVVGCFAAVLWPGHAFQLFSIGALPGVWASMLLDAGGGALAWLLPTIAVGAPLLWFVGMLLDRLDTEIRLWLPIALFVAALAGYAILDRYTDLDAAVARHGTFASIAVCALQLGSYGATLVLLALGAGRGVRR